MINDQKAAGSLPAEALMLAHRKEIRRTEVKEILDQMEEHIAEIRNLQRNFDFHSRRLEKLMINLCNWHREGNDNNEISLQPHPISPLGEETNER